MLWPMIFLAANAAIFYEVTRTILEFYFIDCCFAAVSANFVGLLCVCTTTAHDYRSTHCQRYPTYGDMLVGVKPSKVSKEIDACST
jgi:hypothetical protein